MMILLLWLVMLMVILWWICVIMFEWLNWCFILLNWWDICLNSFLKLLKGLVCCIMCVFIEGYRCCLRR